MVSALAAETQLLAGADARSKDTNSNNNGDSSQGALREDAIREALLTSTFADCSAKLEHIDTNSAEGRREAIEAGFLSGNALVAKVLMWGVRDLGRRHPTLALMLDLRGGSTLTGIADYLSYVHAVDPHTGLVPQRAKRYSTVGETGSRDSELKKWLSLKLHDMDWFCPFVGIHALRSMHTGVSPRPLDPRDHLCVISELEDLIEFGERRLASMGVPISLEAGDTGYSWRSFWQFYIQHLKLARRAATHEEMVRWVSQTVTQGKLALRLIGDTLRRYIDSAFPASAVLGAILPADNQVTLAFKARVDSLNTLINNRELFAWLIPHNTAPNTIATDIPRLSHSSSTRILAGNSGGQPTLGGNPRGHTAAAKNAGVRWLGRKLLVGGLVWNVEKWKAAYGDRYCIMFCANLQNTHLGQRCCDKPTEVGHRHPGDTAHMLPPGETKESLMQAFTETYDTNHSVPKKRPAPRTTPTGDHPQGRGNQARRVAFTSPPAMKGNATRTNATAGRGGKPAGRGRGAPGRGQPPTGVPQSAQPRGGQFKDVSYANFDLFMPAGDLS